MMHRGDNRSRHERETSLVRAALSALLLLAPLSAGAATQTWIGSSGTWDDTTTANWSGGAVPVNGDTVFITTAGVSVAYTATNLSGTGINPFYLHNTGAGTTTFTLDGTDNLPVGTLISVGEAGTGSTTFNLLGNATLSLNGINAFRLGGGGGTAVFNHSGGTFTNGVGGGSLFYANTGGTYNLSGSGAFNANRGLTISGGTWNQTGGTATLPSGYGVDIQAGGTFRLSAGTFTSGSIFTLASNATGEWTGGSITAPSAGGRLQLTGAGAAWTQKGGTLTINVAGTSGVNTLTLVPASTVQGYGTIQDARFGASSPGTFDNSGRVIANGFGADRTFDLSRFGQTPTTSMLRNTTDNATTNGWYAVNKGKLLLPTLGVTSPTSTVFWGESPTDADGIPDLVNSVKLAFTGITAGGTVTGSLLAADRADAQGLMPVNDPRDKGIYALIGAWDFAASGINFGTGSATLTFRYDDLWATKAASDMARLESDLKLLKYNPGTSSWDVLTAGVTLDTGANLMTVAGVTGFSLYGIAMLPEPGTCALGALAAAALLSRRRRR
jgi:hypothetical protein